MKLDFVRFKRLFIRALKLRCPECGDGPIYASLIRVRDHCPVCGLVFQREQGYFIGAIYINIIATESLLFASLILSLLIAPGAGAGLYNVLLILAIVLPVLFFRHSRALWLCIDHFFDPPKGSSEY
ncbi:MAG TPA: DUF983 domain-containing protein [Blastocatellia bacterium]|nr:DUF983 domain-containing protein [Blastocatellia bacterium]